MGRGFEITNRKSAPPNQVVPAAGQSGKFEKVEEFWVSGELRKRKENESWFHRSYNAERALIPVGRTRRNPIDRPCCFDLAMLIRFNIRRGRTRKSFGSRSRITVELKDYLRYGGRASCGIGSPRPGLRQIIPRTCAYELLKSTYRLDADGHPETLQNRRGSKISPQLDILQSLYIRRRTVRSLTPHFFHAGRGHVVFSGPVLTLLNVGGTQVRPSAMNWHTIIFWGRGDTASFTLPTA